MKITNTYMSGLNIVGATRTDNTDREENDYYATDPKAISDLNKYENKNMSKNELITCTAVQYTRDMNYGIQYSEIVPDEIEALTTYIKTQVFFLTEKEFLDLTKMSLEEHRQKAFNELNK